MNKKAAVEGLTRSLRRTLAAFEWNAKTLSRSYGRGKWTAREILAHLTDCELVFLTRLKFLLSEEKPVITPFDQDKWARRGRYPKTNVKNARIAFGVLRREFIAWVKQAKPSEFARRGKHPENPDYDVSYLVEHGIEHNDRHLEQLAAIKAGKSWSLTN